MQADFFQRNRHALAKELKGGVIVLSAYTRMQRSNDAAHMFEQEANFWYLCGINEPDWLLIHDGVQHKSWLIAPDVETVHRIFEGGIGDHEAKKVSGVDAVLSHDDGQTLLRQLAKRHSIAYTVGNPKYADHFNFSLNPKIATNQRMLERQFARVQLCQNELAKLRAIKQPEEIAVMRQAINLTVKAFKEIHGSLSTYRHEYEIEAQFTSLFRRNGASGHGYDPIIAAGPNACTLHYGKNAAKLQNKQLILMDIGAKVSGYSADISRTYAKGTPTKRQLAVHQAVQSAHKQIVSLLEPRLSIETYHEQVMVIMRDVAVRLGLITSDASEESLRRFFPHAISHGLGVDVHDSLGAPRFLEPNMVLTVEPGIYIPDEGIGVRIEDDILITENGHSNLSGALSTDV